jgi:hypothetical protein
MFQNKFYVEVTLHTSLQVQLLNLFRQKVADSRMDTIMGTVNKHLMLFMFASLTQGRNL